MQNTTLRLDQIDDQALFDPLHYAMATRDADVIALVHDALAADRAQLAFQPVVTADKTQHIVYHEGLMRVTDADGRVLPAGHFMPQITDSDLGREIDCVTLTLALQQLQQHPTLRVSVNVSARSIGDGAWRRILERGLLDSAALKERLLFEISEASAMMLHENVIRFMKEMQPRGVGFALDGFGAGMIAFRHLKDFMFDLVKIDKSFVHGVDRNPDNQVLTEALITVAQQFDMFVVADGVETAEEAEFLTALGVDCLQGYYIGAPSFTL